MAVENFLTEDEVESLKSSCFKLVDDMDPREHKGVFSATDHKQVSIRARGDALVVTGLLQLGRENRCVVDAKM